jgi:hypothetical protein
MYVCSPRSRRPLGSGSRGHWVAWLPLVFLGSMMFWTIALVLGGWSLMVVSDGALEAAGPAPTVTEPMPGVDTQGAQGAGGTFDRIPVQVEESQEPEDVDDNPGSVHTSVPVRESVIY